MTGISAERRPATPPCAAPQRRIPGEEGLWVFILGDMGVFALLFGLILVLRGQQNAMFHAAQSHLHPVLGIVNTVLLLTGSFGVVLATRAVRAGAGRSAAALLAATIACGLGFVVVKGAEYSNLVDAGFTPQTNDFFMYYFVITGIHLGHLVIGLVLLAVLGLRVRQVTTPVTAPRILTECAACYWHMVDLLWLVLFPLLYLVR